MPSNLAAQGPTALVAASQTPPAGVQCGTVAGNQIASYLLYNDGTVTAFVSTGKTSAAAQLNAVIPTAAAPMQVYPVPAKGYLPVNDLVNAFWSGITASGTANVFVTPVAAQNS